MTGSGSERRSHRATTAAAAVGCIYKVAMAAVRDKAPKLQLQQQQWGMVGCVYRSRNEGRVQMRVGEHKQGWGAQTRVGNTNKEWEITNVGCRGQKRATPPNLSL